MPGYLMSRKKFTEKYEKNIFKNEDRVALSNFKKAIAPFILRRKKKDVLIELPEKIETTLVCKLTEEQKDIYTAYLLRTRKEIDNLIEEEGFEKSHIQILAAITRLRQICCHPAVFLEDYNGGSGKLDLLEELIDELVDGQHRILLFSQFTSLLKIIRESINKKGMNYLYLDGSTPVHERMDLVDRFNSGFGEVFLISLKAGGTGLNLTSADVVIHFDPWWNPAVEDQATDRAHRIGQENVVQVFKLITKDTIEEKIIELQNKKKDLINAVIQDGEVFINKLTEEELLDLFKI
jgi:SNF2 family DNA or RNA helicase